MIKNLLYVLLGVVLTVSAFGVEHLADTITDIRVVNATQDVEIQSLSNEIIKIEKYLAGQP